MAARSYVSTPNRWDTSRVLAAYTAWRNADNAYAEMAKARVLARYQPGTVSYPTDASYERMRLKVRILRGIFWALSSPRKDGNVTVTIGGVSVSVPLAQAQTCARWLDRGGELQLIQTSTGDSIRLINV